MFGAEVAERRLGDVVDNRYELQALVGSGMTGAVYRATHLFLRREVAVKVMHQGLHGDDNAVARFLREAHAVTAIGHPAIVEVLDAGVTIDGMPYVVLELLVGRSLGDEFERRGALPADEVIAIGRDILGGLGAAHDAGLVHRDLKPDNVFLLDEPGEGPRLKILDFGVAKHLKSTGMSGVLTKPGATIGTPNYMSPEQARAAPVGIQADVWSAGALLFHALAGCPPFVGVSIPALLLKLVTTPAPKLRDVCPDAPASLARAVDGALLADLTQRWLDSASMASALNGAEE